MTDKIKRNAEKITFLVQQYPEHTIQKVIELLVMPSVDINAAIWAAQDLGFIAKPDPETGTIDLIKVPEVWNFGPEIEELRKTLLYCFSKLAKAETDLEEQNLSFWTQGYASHDVLIAVKLLLNAKLIAEYQIEDGEPAKDGTPNEYTFYTLYDNREQMWGRKAFKVDPLAENNNNAPEGEKEKSND